MDRNDDRSEEETTGVKTNHLFRLMQGNHEAWYALDRKIKQKLESSVGLNFSLKEV